MFMNTRNKALRDTTSGIIQRSWNICPLTLPDIIFTDITFENVLQII